jgi:hypothetical protein
MISRSSPRGYEISLIMWKTIIAPAQVQCLPNLYTSVVIRSRITREGKQNSFKILHLVFLSILIHENMPKFKYFVIGCRN